MPIRIKYERMEVEIPNASPETVEQVLSAMFGRSQRALRLRETSAPRSRSSATNSGSSRSRTAIRMAGFTPSLSSKVLSE